MKSQRGGFVMGLIVGLLAGLALALGVALYVTKVPVPFVNKVPQRTAEQDAAEAEKNKNWDPNSPLYGKNPARPTAGASGPSVPAPDAAASAMAATPAPRAPVPASTRDAAAILGDKAVATTPAAKASSPLSTATVADPFSYFVQAGAYARSEDAEQQRARIAMLGYEAKLTEREQSGRTVYRVRLGPFDNKDEADSTKEKLTGAGVDAALVRVQK
jgi:cell division protein FtsN